MPDTREILDKLQSLANDYFAIAIFWHIAFYILLALLFTKWAPSNRLFGILVSLPLLSVALFAWISGNPFNGALFSLLAILVFVFGLKTSPKSVATSAFPFWIMGVLMIIFGLVYPHFISGGGFIRYFYATPLGLVPCPTLSLLIGFMLLYNGFESGPMSLVFIVFGLFYGFFGVFKLGVFVDVGLIIGALTLLVKYILMVKNPVG